MARRKAQPNKMVYRHAYLEHGQHFGNLLRFQDCKEELDRGKSRFCQSLEFNI